MWDECPDFELSFTEVHAAASDKRLIPLLASRFEGKIDLSLFSASDKETRDVEDALHMASGALEGRERRKTGVNSSGLCLVTAIILEAIQEQFCEKLRTLDRQ
jgi:hypothetical protein